MGKSSSSLNKSRTSSTESSKSLRSNSRDLSPTSSVDGAGFGGSGVAGGVFTPKTARKLQKTKAILLSPTKLLPPKSKSEEGTETTGGEDGRRKGQVRRKKLLKIKIEVLAIILYALLFFCFCCFFVVFVFCF